MDWTFEWDDAKAQANLKKHKIDFEEATSIFNDPFSITIHDPDHSLDEERFIELGMSSKSRILIVVYTEQGGTIRIISSRKANPTERRRYEEKYN